jgi:hypothetical protein
MATWPLLLTFGALIIAIAFGATAVYPLILRLLPHRSRATRSQSAESPATATDQVASSHLQAELSSAPSMVPREPASVSQRQVVDGDEGAHP